MANETTSLLNTMGGLKQKFVVDMVNSLDVVDDHQRTAENRSGFFARLYDGFTGKAELRRTEISGNLAESLNASVQLVQYLANEVSDSNLAITRVNDRLADLIEEMNDVAELSIETSEQLQSVVRLAKRDFEALKARLAGVELVVRAEQNLARACNKWEAGKFANLSLGGRCVAVLEELRWGAFGELVRSLDLTDHDAYLDDLTDRLTALLSRDLCVRPRSRQATYERWLVFPSNSSLEQEGVSYLADWATPHDAPFTFSATQSPEELPLGLPLISSASRVSSALVAEAFGVFARDS